MEEDSLDFEPYDSPGSVDFDTYYIGRVDMVDSEHTDFDYRLEDMVFDDQPVDKVDYH